MTGKGSYPWFVRKDLDGFFGLAIDNLIQLMLIVTLSKFVAGMPDSLIFGYILPGAALSIIGGNIFYSIQARTYAIKIGTVTAWVLNFSGISGYFEPDWSKGVNFNLHIPIPVIGDIFSMLGSEYVWRYMSVIIPMGLFNVVGSLQNL